MSERGQIDAAAMREMLGRRLAIWAKGLAADEYDGRGARAIARQVQHMCKVYSGLLDGDPPIPDVPFEELSERDKERYAPLLIGVPTKARLEKAREWVKQQTQQDWYKAAHPLSDLEGEEDT